MGSFEEMAKEGAFFVVSELFPIEGPRIIHNYFHLSVT